MTHEFQSKPNCSRIAFQMPVVVMKERPQLLNEMRALSLDKSLDSRSFIVLQGPSTPRCLILNAPEREPQMPIFTLTRQGMRRFIFATMIATFACGSSFAQTNSFPYQGKLNDGGSPATRNYDFQFTLWDALSGGTQQPQPAPITVALSNVPVS